jgi:ubiquinone/menaquinone biosynthesis C-methylase UbiE
VSHVVPTAPATAYTCPACRAAIDRAESITCPACGRRYETIAGIPDLRLEYPDPYTSRLEDAQAAETLAEHSQDVDLGGLLREHWRMTDKPELLTERFVARDVAALEQAESYVDAVEGKLGRRLGPGDRVLEVGCGTAALAAVVAGRGSAVVATDVSMRWLVLADKRMEDLGLNVELACCGAEALPFGEGEFDLVIAGDVVEHVADQRLFVLESARVLAPGGLLFLATPNRYSLGLEPHVRLWGVGLLPRPTARWYVERVRRTGYDHVRLLSSRALRRLLEAAGLRVTIETPAVPESSQRLAHGFERRLMRAYNAMRGVRVVRSGLLLVGPFFHVFAVKDGAR